MEFGFVPVAAGAPAAFTSAIFSLFSGSIHVGGFGLASWSVVHLLDLEARTSNVVRDSACGCSARNTEKQRTRGEIWFPTHAAAATAAALLLFASVLSSPFCRRSLCPSLRIASTTVVVAALRAEVDRRTDPAGIVRQCRLHPRPRCSNLIS